MDLLAKGADVIIAANWKMNPSLADAARLVAAYAGEDFEGVTRVLFPPAPYIVQMGVRLDGSGVLIGGQDCHQDEAGAHTGDVSAGMLADCGAHFALLGHSERRQDHGESDELVMAKAHAALAAGLSVMICVGETLDQRDAGNAVEVVTAQLAGSIPADLTVTVSLSPTSRWAIGTGKVAASKTSAPCMFPLALAGRARLGTGSGALWRVGQAGQCGRDFRGWRWEARCSRCRLKSKISARSAPPGARGASSVVLKA